MIPFSFFRVSKQQTKLKFYSVKRFSAVNRSHIHITRIFITVINFLYYLLTYKNQQANPSAT